MVGAGLASLTVVLGLTIAHRPAATLADLSRTDAGGASSTSQRPGQVRASARAVGPDISWQVVSETTERQIENAYLAPLRSSGTFLVIEVTATNDAQATAVLDGDDVGLELGGAVFGLDQTALEALELAGHSGLTPVDLAPGESETGIVVFDVPPASADSTPELCVRDVHAAVSGRGGACG